MAKYVEVSKVDEKLVKVKKRVTFFLFSSVISCVLGVVCTVVGFFATWSLIVALVFEVLTPVAMLLAFNETMRYKHGKAGK